MLLVKLQYPNWLRWTYERGNTGKQYNWLLILATNGHLQGLNSTTTI
jgi:hypothetical protein